ncbi:MAG: dTDP-4-dehydrorhamnose 3,5-epimerase [Magnetococcales bacterium]|nr:dTDP-4-dehydrorhamnose 3,5-epimerase [Magnetococcales bacterium]
MQFTPTELPEVILVEPRVFGDLRGFFMETYHQDRFHAAGITATFVQDNHSGSTRGTLRGLHYQQPYAQGKLVRAVSGSILDVVVDIRRGSPRFGRWTAMELSADNRRQLWVPAGFAHGFVVLSDAAQIVYKATDLYHPEAEHGIIWDDPDLAIDWGGVTRPILSDKDRAFPRLADARVLPDYIPQSSS